MSDPFIKACDFVIDVLEGGGALVEDRDDPGGTTRWGISQGAYPHLDIKTLTREKALSLYHQDYWVPCQAERLHPPIALQLFAAYVNMRPERAIKCLQEAVTGVKQDGIIGPKTILAVTTFRPQQELRARFSRACIEFYIGLVRKHPPLVKYLHGWIGRVCRVADEAGAWSKL